MKSKKVEVENPEPEVPTKILAQSIVKISDGFRKLMAGGLSERAVVVLVQDCCGGHRYMSQETIRTVIAALQNLESTFVRRRKDP